MTSEVRPFKSEDAPTVRRIFLDTADAGEPLNGRFPDAALLAEAWTRYYIEDEPQSLWVAERDARVVGYLTGCLDEQRFQARMRWRMGPALLAKGLFRGIWLKPLFWRLLWVNRSLAHTPDERAAITQYPGHFHVNLADGYRRQGLGRALIAQFLASAAQAGCRGVRAATRDDNAAIHHLLESLGFTRLHRVPTFRWADDPLPRWKVTYGRAL